MNANQERIDEIRKRLDGDSPTWRMMSNATKQDITFLLSEVERLERLLED